MKRLLLSVFASTLLLILFLPAGCKEKKPRDEKTSEAVKSTTTAIDKNITATVKDSVVTLTGEVMDEATRTAAIKAVKHIEGVKQVESFLTVKSPVVETKKSSAGDSLSDSL